MATNTQPTVTIHLTEWDAPRTVARKDYVTAKTKQLREFGYEDLSESHVSEQLDKILADDNDLTVIGMFMKDEIRQD